MSETLKPSYEMGEKYYLVSQEQVFDYDICHTCGGGDSQKKPGCHVCKGLGTVPVKSVKYHKVSGPLKVQVRYFDEISLYGGKVHFRERYGNKKSSHANRHFQEACHRPWNESYYRYAPYSLMFKTRKEAVAYADKLNAGRNMELVNRLKSEK